MKTVWVKAHGGSNPSSSATKTRQILSGFLLLRKSDSCAICDCARLCRRTPYHGADASLLRVNSLAPLLNESSSSANKTDKHFLLVRFVFRYLIRGIRTRALRKRHGASFLAAARRLLQSIKIADQGCFAKDKNESLFLRQRQEIRTTAVRISCFFRFWKGFKRVCSRLVTRDLYFTKKTSHINKTERKTLRRKKSVKLKI